jgi:hypothetical protein
LEIPVNSRFIWETVETVLELFEVLDPRLKPGVNEKRLLTQPLKWVAFSLSYVVVRLKVKEPPVEDGGSSSFA